MRYQIKIENTFGKSLRDIVLDNRNLTNEDANFLINPTNEYLEFPSRIKNLEEGAKLFMLEVDKESNIGIVIDPDVDGFTSSALVYLFLTNECQVPKEKVQYFIHEGKQHSLSDEKLFKDIKKSKIDFLIVPDAGTNDTKEIKELLKDGKRVLVLDHHNLSSEDLTTLYKNQNGELVGVIVNNQINEYSRCLAGVGVVYKLLVYLTENELLHYEDLVAVGNIADSMELNDRELRFIINRGLSNVNNGLIKEYMENAKLKELTPTDVSFNIANYINGTIRFGTQKEKIDLFRALIGEEEEIEFKPRKSKNNPNPELEMQSLQKIMVRTSESVKRRQDKRKMECLNLCKEYIDNNNIDDNKVIIVIDEDNSIIDKRITGLVAMQLSDIYKKSVMLLSRGKDGKFIGSMRGYGVDNFKKILELTGIIKVMGHNNSAGVEVEKKDIPRLIKRVNRVMEDIEIVNPCVEVDCEIDIESITKSDMESILELIPIWHQHCKEPLFLIKDFELDSKKVRIPYATLMTFKIGKHECKKNFCSKVFQEEFLHTNEIKFARPKLKCNLLVKIGFDDYNNKPCFILEKAETSVIDKNSKAKNDKKYPF